MARFLSARDPVRMIEQAHVVAEADPDGKIGNSLELVNDKTAVKRMKP